jgi:hypothetical protein
MQGAAKSKQEMRLQSHHLIGHFRTMSVNLDLVIFRNLIAYYIQRQRLVVLALVDVCSAALANAGVTSILGIDLAPYIEAYEDGHYTQIGIWKNDWQYRHHGIGCELRHLKTGEYFDWDAPDPDAFYMGVFSDHLKWRMKYEADDPYVKAYAQRKIPFEMICDLAIHKGLLRLKDDGLHKWIEE